MLRWGRLPTAFGRSGPDFQRIFLGISVSRLLAVVSPEKNARKCGTWWIEFPQPCTIFARTQPELAEMDRVVFTEDEAMKRLILVVAISWSLFGLGTDADAARRCRTTRRTCAGVTHQPCAPAALRAPQSQNTVDGFDECVCAFWECQQGPGYNGYYGGDFWPDCNTAHWVYITGYYDVNTPDPCPTCPAAQCLTIIRNTSTTPGGPYHKPGTKASRLLKWNEKLALKSGTGKFKRADGSERVVEFECKEFADAKMLVSFTSGNVQYFAKLHSFRVESQELGASKIFSVSDFAIGQEIQPLTFSPFPNKMTTDPANR